MGCDLGKLAGSAASGGGGGGGGGGDERGNSKHRDGRLEEPPSPGPPDPRLPLTAKQKYSMIASWKGISRAMEPTGVFMFIKLFEEHEELLQLFTKFGELKTRDAQANSMELAEHANKVMTTLDEGIKELDDLDNFFQYLTQVGATHKTIPGFNPDYFWKIEVPFLEAVKTTLGDRFTENIETIYKITIKLIIETLIKGYTEAGP